MKRIYFLIGLLWCAAAGAQLNAPGNTGTITTGGGTNLQQIIGVNGGGVTGNVSQVGNNATITFPGPVTNNVSLPGNNITVSCVTNGNVITCTFNGLASTTTGTTTIVTSGKFLTDNIQAGTNTLAWTSASNNEYQAVDYFRFDGSDDSTNWPRFLTATSTNAKVRWPAGKVMTLSTNWGALVSVFNLNFSHVLWDGNGVKLNLTVSNATGGSYFFNLENSTDFHFNRMSFQMPPIATNDTLNLSGGWFAVNQGGGTCYDIGGDSDAFSGGRFGMATTSGGGFLYKFHFYSTIGSNIGSPQATPSGDGAIFAIGGVDVVYDPIWSSNNFNTVETYVPAGGQTNCTVVAKNVMVIDPMGTPFYPQYSVTGLSADIENWHITNPSRSANSLYAAKGGIIFNSIKYASAKHIRIDPPFNQAGISTTGNTFLDIDDFQCTNCTGSAGNITTVAAYSLRNSNPGSLTISADSAGTIINVPASQFANSGTLNYLQDAAGNEFNAGSLTVAGAIIVSNSITLNSIVILNSAGTLSLVSATNNIYHLDTSAGAITVPFKTGANLFPVGRTAWFVLTNASPNTATIDFGSGAVNGQTLTRTFLLKSQGDTLFVRKESATYWDVLAGNVWSNITASSYRFGDGTVQTTAATNTVDTAGTGSQLLLIATTNTCTTSSNSSTDLIGPSTFTTTGTHDLVFDFNGQVGNSTINSFIFFSIKLDGTTQKGPELFVDAGTGLGISGQVFAGRWPILSVTGGVHTVSVQWRTPGGTANAGDAQSGGNGQPPNLVVTQK